MKPRRASRIEVFALRTLPEIRRGDDLAAKVLAAARREGAGILPGDVIVLTQKIVSKAEGRLVSLGRVRASRLAEGWARRLRRDPRYIEVVLRESRRVVRMSERALITETRHGLVCANAGVDRSNLPGRDAVCCLPRDPDGSARRFVRGIERRLGVRVAAIISDTFGRPWRLGLVNVAIGAAGFRVLEDWRGRSDTQGRRLHATVLAIADELAAAAGLVMGKTENVPVAIIRGYRYRAGQDAARRLIRPPEQDLFR